MLRPQRLTNLLTDLFASQKLAVLGTQRNGHPYNCLVAFASTGDLKNLLFATQSHTRKYQSIKAEPRVAILIDNRSNREADFSRAIAVTGTGKAKEIKGIAKERFLKIYLAKHPHLRNFVSSPDNALIKIEIDNYVISSFDEVKMLRPR